MALSYIPGEVRSAVNAQNSLTGNMKNQANKLNSLSNSFTNQGNTLNQYATGNLLRYGEVNEGDLVNRAATDNTLAYGKAYDSAVRDMTRMGINPNSGRFAGMSQSYALNRAAAEAGARNQARLQARNENFQRANSIANLGYNYNSLGLNAANSALNAINSAAANNQRYASGVGYIAGIENDIDQRNDQIAYGRQLLGNNWGGTDTQALAAVTAHNLKFFK
jgi:hypothetical protein